MESASGEMLLDLPDDGMIPVKTFFFQQIADGLPEAEFISGQFTVVVSVFSFVVIVL